VSATREPSADHRDAERIAEYHLRELEIALDPSHPAYLMPDIRAHHERVLDVGCGAGQTLVGIGFAEHRPARVAFGIDSNFEAIRFGRSRWPDLELLVGQGECLPFPNEYFDLVLSRVALPYMDVPVALREFARVLRPHGDLWVSFHPLDMALGDLWRAVCVGALKSTVYRLYVLLNGVLLMTIGRTARWPFGGRRVESWQSPRAMRRQLAASGFTDVQLRRVGRKAVVTARRHED
jgi:ubiquinone/menaquinone biosynthesis C-methylase UbiE